MERGARGVAGVRVAEDAVRAWNALPPPGGNTSIADYVWLPFRFDGEMGTLDWRDAWSPADFD